MRQIVRRERPADQEALRRLHAKAAQTRELNLVLDALGGHGLTQRLRNGDDGFRDRNRPMVG